MVQGWWKQLRALRERGQSEVLGATLLTGIIVVLVALGGLFLFADFEGDDEQLLANIEGEITATDITLTHNGGDTFNSSEVAVVLTGDNERDLNLAADFNTTGGSGELAPGDVWEYSTNGSVLLGEGRLLVVHEPTNTVLYDEGYLIRVVPGGIEIRVESFSDSGKQSDQADVYGDSDGVRWNYDAFVNFDDDSDPVRNPDILNISLDPDPDTQDALENNNSTKDLVAYEPDSGPPENVTVTASIDGYDGEDEVLVSVYPIADVNVTVDEVGKAGTLSSSGFSTLSTDTTELIEGETLKVRFNITNEESYPAIDREVKLFANATGGKTIGPNSTTIERLDGGETVTRNLTLDTRKGDGGDGSTNYTVTLVTDGSKTEASEDVVVFEPISFNVTNVELNTTQPVRGDNFMANVTLKNEGGLEGTTNLTVDPGSLGTNKTADDITLDGGNSTKRNFTLKASKVGEYTVKASEDTNSSTGTATLNVLQPAALNVLIEEPDIVQNTLYSRENNSLDVTVNVTNTGNTPAIGDFVNLRLGGYKDTKMINNLGSGDNVIKTFSIPKGELNLGDYTVKVFSNTTIDTADVQIVDKSTELVATLSDEEVTPSGTADADLAVVSLDGTGEDISAYQLKLSYDNSVADFDSVKSGDWDSSSATDTGDKILTNNFGLDDSTPSEPALTFRFDASSQGISNIEFNNSGAGGDNAILDSSNYNVFFDNGSVEVSGPADVSNFAVSNPTGREVDIEITSSGLLSEIQVSVSGESAATLTEADFTESYSNGEYSYKATYEAPSDGDYTVTLDTAIGLTGQDDASGQSETVTVSIISQDETVLYQGLTATSGDGGDTAQLGPDSVNALGPSSEDLTGDGTNDMPYIDSNGNLKLLNGTGGTQTLVPDSDGSSPAESKTLMAVGQWNGSDTSVFYADDNNDALYRVDDSGSTTEVVDPGDGAQGVLGTGDIDDDGTKELIFSDGSQQVQYLESDGSVTKLSGGGVGSNNGLGVGRPPDFDGDGTVRALVVDGSNRVKLVGDAEPTKTFDTDSSTNVKTNAKKAPLTATDVDNDGTDEIVYIGNDDGKLKYVDDPLGNPTIEFLKDEDGNKISGDDNLGVVS
jgi:hypothetical protein